MSGKLLAVHSGAASKGSQSRRICEAGWLFSKRGHWKHCRFSFSCRAVGCCAACSGSRRRSRIRSKVLRAVRVVQPSEVEWRHIGWRGYVDESCVDEGRVRDRTAVGRSAAGGRRQGSLLVTATALSISGWRGTEQADKEVPVTITSDVNHKLASSCVWRYLALQQQKQYRPPRWNRNLQHSPPLTAFLVPKSGSF